MESWVIPTLIPTVTVLLSSAALWWRVTRDAVRIAAKLATKDDIKELRSEMKSDHGLLSNKIEKLDDSFVRHLEYHLGYKHKK